ncbi:unnamed protein product [Effrenium voratum]|nr:unnamed protein product [Effrenium voratum]
MHAGRHRPEHRGLPRCRGRQMAPGAAVAAGGLGPEPAAGRARRQPGREMLLPAEKLGAVPGRPARALRPGRRGALRRPSGLRPNAITCNSAISACSRTQRWLLAIEFLREMCNQSLRLLSTSLDAATSVWHQAVLMLARRASRGMGYSVIGANVAAAALAAGSGWHRACVLTDRGDAYGWTAVISSCRWERAQALACRMALLRVARNVVTLNALIGSREAVAKPWEGTLRLLRGDAVTCSSLIASCTAGLQWQQAVEALDAARGGLRLDGIAWGTAVAAWASGSMWEASLRQAVTTLSNWEGLSGAVTSTVLGSCLRWQAAVGFWSWTASRGPDCANADCASAALRALQLGAAWRQGLALAMLSGTLKAQPAAAENLEKALARPGAFEGLLRHLRQLRREVLRKTARGTWNLNGDERYKNLPLLTRIGLTAIFGCTVLVQLGFLDPMLLALNWPVVINKLQVWRLLTPVLFFGTFSFQFLFQMYFFTSFSSKLEQNEAFSQPGDYLFFLLLQILLLDVISLALSWPTGLPMLGPSLVFAILYYWSRREPYAKLSFFSFAIQGYQFPFALIFFQLLIGGNIWMDLLGLASGHIYYFLAEVVPQEYGYSLIKTPAFLANFMARYTGGTVRAPQPTQFQGRGRTLGGN